LTWVMMSARVAAAIKDRAAGKLRLKSSGGEGGVARAEVEWSAVIGSGDLGRRRGRLELVEQLRDVVSFFGGGVPVKDKFR